MTKEQMQKKFYSELGKKSAEARKAKMGEEAYKAFMKGMSKKGNARFEAKVS